MTKVYTGYLEAMKRRIERNDPHYRQKAFNEKRKAFLRTAFADTIPATDSGDGRRTAGSEEKSGGRKPAPAKQNRAGGNPGAQRASGDGNRPKRRRGRPPKNRPVSEASGDK